MTRLLLTPYWLAAALLVIGLGWTASAGLVLTLHWSAVLGPFVSTVALLAIGFFNRTRWRHAPEVWLRRASLAALAASGVGLAGAWAMVGPAYGGIALQAGGLVGMVALAVVAARAPARAER